MGDTIKTLMSLIRFEIKGEPLPTELRAGLSIDVLKELFVLSKKHDLAHLVGSALEKNKLLPAKGKIRDKFYNEIVISVYRFEQLNYEFHVICDTFEQTKIPFVPLKGSVIRDYYPEPWMRTSCDIDILIRKEDTKRAIRTLTEELSYKQGEKGSHDIPFETLKGLCVELHYDLIEGSIGFGSESLFKNAWDCVYAKTGSVRYSMTDEMFYSYHIAHMAKHFVIGGCGIRPFIDLWILNHRIQYDPEKRQRCIREIGLVEFERAAVKLSETWFENAEPDELTEMMKSFILSGGVYGNMKNRVAMQQHRKGGKFRYIMSRIFMPYSSLKYIYPVLEKHKWLLPFMEVRRWFRLMLKGRMKRSANEMRINRSISAEEQAENAKMLKMLGL